MKIKQLIDAFQHKITESSKYEWNSFGPNARAIDFSSDAFYMPSAHSGLLVYDTKTLELFLTEVHQHSGKSYRWVNPSYLNVYKAEHVARGFNFGEAYDDKKFINIDEPEDFLEKATAIFNDEEFDERIMVKLHDFPDELFMQLAKLAHQEDLTINQMAEKVLQSYIDSDGQL
jgi:hypothetical protein